MPVHPVVLGVRLEALHAHGTRRGLWLTLRRSLRCRPFGPSGWDPVPDPATTHFATSTKESDSR